MSNRLLPSSRLVLSLLLAALPGVAQGLVAKPEALRGKTLVRSYRFEAAERDVEYALYVPRGYDGERDAPLVVMLHGLGSNPRQAIGYRGITDEAEKRGYLVVAPFGFNERGWYGSRGKGKEGAFFGKKDDPDNLGELSEQDVFNVLTIVEQEFKVDPKQRFLMGHSMGGAGTVYLGATRRGMWAALAPLAPALGGPMDLLAGLGQTPVFVVMGDKDRMVPVATVRQWVQEMQRLKTPVRYEEIAGGDHVRVIAQNPEMIGEVFDFFDAVRGQQAATPQRPSDAPPSTDGPTDKAKPQQGARDEAGGEVR